jgi:hypothetical protein
MPTLVDDSHETLAANFKTVLKLAARVSHIVRVKWLTYSK